jgi:hypothetical protein
VAHSMPLFLHIYVYMALLPYYQQAKQPCVVPLPSFKRIRDSCDYIYTLLIPGRTRSLYGYRNTPSVVCTNVDADRMSNSSPGTKERESSTQGDTAHAGRVPSSTTFHEHHSSLILLSSTDPINPAYHDGIPNLQGACHQAHRAAAANYQPAFPSI